MHSRCIFISDVYPESVIPFLRQILARPSPVYGGSAGGWNRHVQEYGIYRHTIGGQQAGTCADPSSASLEFACSFSIDSPGCIATRGRNLGDGNRRLGLGIRAEQGKSNQGKRDVLHDSNL